MIKSPDELRKQALTNVAEAIETGKDKVKITLHEVFSSDTDAIKQFCEKLQVKQTTELLREKFSEYQIRSTVASEGYLKGIITYTKSPCWRAYTLVWTLQIKKK